MKMPDKLTGKPGRVVMRLVALGAFTVAALGPVKHGIDTYQRYLKPLDHTRAQIHHYNQKTGFDDYTGPVHTLDNYYPHYTGDMQQAIDSELEGDVTRVRDLLWWHDLPEVAVLGGLGVALMIGASVATRNH